MMAETLTPLIIATLAFVLSHFVLSWTPLRTPLVGALGRWGFIALYSVAALGTFVWMNMAYTRAPLIDLWAGDDWAWYLSLVVMLLACILLVCGVLTPNPTAVIGERLLKRDDPATGIFRVTRHPVMWAITLWALCHMASTGDAASQIFFGGIGGLAFLGMLHMDARRDRTGDPDWQRFRGRTSFVPFLAALQGRTRISLRDIGWVRMAVGVVLYLVLLEGHEWAIGVVVAPWVPAPA